MACAFEITLDAADASWLLPAQAALNAIDAIEAQLTVFRDTSGISDINTRAARAQSVLLVALRTLIGWHFLYEGYFKLLTPGWRPDGHALSAWSSSSYLRAASGPFASLFQGSTVTPLFERPRSTRLQIQRFCSAIRVGTPLACGPDKAFDSARSCIRANESVMQKARLAI